MYNEINNLSERAEALDKKLEGMIQGIQECREELARIWGFKLEEEPVKEVLTIYDWEDGDIVTFSLYNEAGHMIEEEFTSVDEALQWATDNGYTVEGY
jgi:hypothetical protein